MDATLLTILLLLAFATVLAIIQARRRDRCLKDFDQFRVTLAEKDGDLTWGRAEIHASGLEVVYADPVVTRAGHLERSFLFFKDQYETMDALYRYPEGLPPEEQKRRAEIIARTAQPGFGRRLWRKLRTWMSMVRDALVQSVGLVVGMTAKTRPGAAVLSSQEQQIKALSGEVIGHAGNAFDPLLEQHLFRQVVLEVTLDGATRSYCGWLKDYTSQFIEVVDAYANAVGTRAPESLCVPGQSRADGVLVQAARGRFLIENKSDHVLNVQRVEAADWSREVDCLLPPGYAADVALPAEVDAQAARAHVGAAERIDLVVPRTHAIVRHAADGSAARRDTPGASSVMTELAAEKEAPEKTAPGTSANGAPAEEAGAKETSAAPASAAAAASSS